MYLFNFGVIILLLQGLGGILAACDGIAQSIPHELSSTYGCSHQMNSSGVTIFCSRKGNQPYLNEIPPKLPRDLIQLMIEHHRLTDITKNDFAGCLKLRNINFRHNHIRKIDYEAFNDLVNLKNLSLDVNHLDLSDNDSVPTGCLLPLKNLKELWINCNNWHNAKNYTRLHHLVNDKPHLYLLSMDLIKGVDLPVLKYSTLNNLTVLIIYGGINGTFMNTTLDNWAHLPIENFDIHTNQLGEDEKLIKIQPNALRNLTKLKGLSLSFNSELGFTQNLYDGFTGLSKTLTSLYLGAIVSSKDAPYLTDEFLRKFKDCNITALHLDKNYLIGINASFSYHMPNLKYLSLSYNRLFAYVYKGVLSPLVKLKHLEYLNLDKQTRLAMPHDPRAMVTYTGRPGLKSEMFFQGIHIQVDLPRGMKFLYLSDSLDDGSLMLGRITVKNGPYNLSMIDLSQNKLSVIHGPIISDHNIFIRTMNLSHCDLQKLGEHIFSEKLIIETLDLSFNEGIGSEISDDDNGLLIANMEKSKIKNLVLHMCNIKFISGYIFNESYSLEKITLYDNAIGGWRTRIGHLPNLRHLDISNNKFLWLLPEIMEDMDQLDVVQKQKGNKGFEFDISLNPLQIQCDTLKTLKWLHTTNVTLLNYDKIYFYRFTGTHDERFFVNNLSTIIPQMEIHCSSKTWIIATSSMCGFIVVLIIVSNVIFRNRWDIRYFCLRLVRQRKLYQQLEDDKEYEFDAFVAHHDKDIGWVRNELMRMLEKAVPSPLKLCVHKRDWIPGTAIEENISMSVEKSRKTLVILSRNFLKSGWCEFEMQMARIKSFEEGQDIILVVAIEDIPFSEMSRMLGNLRRSDTWLEWPKEDQPAQDVFWKQLRKAIKRPSGKIARCFCGAVPMSGDHPVEHGRNPKWILTENGSLRRSRSFP